jgi:tRNA 2-thiouridine synthesizing protein A
VDPQAHLSGDRVLKPGHGESASADPPEAAWDAGPMGCGELVLELRFRLLALPPGGRLRIRATDTAAPLDLPAWSRLTGHPLIRAEHPIYWFQRKD